MIITLTLNPALDKTVEVSGFCINSLNKEIKTIKDPGGKGINVSKVLKSLGINSIATGFLGGDTGKFIENSLKAIGIGNDFVNITDETRTNLKIYDNTTEETTELNELGPIICDKKLEELKVKLLGYANESSIFVLSGSAPRGIEKNIYKEVIMELVEKGSKVILDADGDLLKYGIEAKPMLIKPNIHELERLNDIKLNTIDEIVKCCKTYIEKGIQNVVVSMGSEGALLVTNGLILKANPIKVKAHSSVGAGDAFVGAIAYALQNNLDVKSMMKLAIATSAGAVMTEGTKPMSREWIFENKEKVVIEIIS